MPYTKHLRAFLVLHLIVCCPTNTDIPYFTLLRMSHTQSIIIQNYRFHTFTYTNINASQIRTHTLMSDCKAHPHTHTQCRRAQLRRSGSEASHTSPAGPTVVQGSHWPAHTPVWGGQRSAWQAAQCSNRQRQGKGAAHLPHLLLYSYSHSKL